MELQLKQRLVGAIVLVSLAVIFIPVILEGPDDDLTPRFQNLPEAPHIDYNARVELPLPASPAGAEQQAQPTAETGDGQATADTRPEPVPLVPAPPREPPVVQQASVPDTVPPAAAVPPPGWYVQVGSFSQQANAGSVLEKLDKAGYQAHVQQVSTAGGRNFRVLVGPAATREAATVRLDKLASTLQMKGLVIEVPGGAH